VTANARCIALQRIAWRRGGEKKNEDGISLSMACLSPTTIVEKGTDEGQCRELAFKTELNLPGR